MRFEKVFGTPSEKPELYWTPWLGGQCGLRPEDLADLTYQQLMSCFDYVTARPENA